MNLRTYAAGKPCYVRLPDCLPGTESVVLAHVRVIGISGAGLKADDLLACPACAHCHDLIDGRKRMANLTRDEAQLAHFRGVLRWQDRLLKDEIVTY
jgi:hypothetical protein